MKNKETLQNLLKELPKTLGAVKEEVDTVGKSFLEAKIRDSQLVTRDEFNEQREKLDIVIQKLSDIEEAIQKLNQSN